MNTILVLIYAFEYLLIIPIVIHDGMEKYTIYSFLIKRCQMEHFRSADCAHEGLFKNIQDILKCEHWTCIISFMFKIDIAKTFFIVH